MRELARACFWLVGDKNVELPDLDHLLGVTADGSAKIGEVAPGTALPSERTIWWLEECEIPTCGDAFAPAVELCLDRLLSRLEAGAIAEKIRVAGLIRYAKISLGGFCAELRDANIVHTPERVCRLAKLGVTIEEDFYQLADTLDSG